MSGKTERVAWLVPCPAVKAMITLDQCASGSCKFHGKNEPQLVRKMSPKGPVTEEVGRLVLCGFPRTLQCSPQERIVEFADWQKP
jgi:hypothetical protein